jgi:hypothetical protein
MEKLVADLDLKDNFSIWAWKAKYTVKIRHKKETSEKITNPFVHLVDFFRIILRRKSCLID